MEDIELQLLCVVMSENTVAVKVEHGDAPQGIYADGWYGKIFLCTRTFPEFRAFIDALEEKPPVPRIERTHKGYRLITKESHCRLDQMSLFTSAYNALSQLAGKPLPIWTPTKGEWKQVVRQQLSDGNPTGAGCDVWRYTRRKA